MSCVMPHRLAVITNEFHMPRTRAIFDLVFNLPPTLPSPAAVEPSPYKLTYITVPDVGMDKQSAGTSLSRRRARKPPEPLHTSDLV